MLYTLLVRANLCLLIATVPHFQAGGGNKNSLLAAVHNSRKLESASRAPRLVADGREVETCKDQRSAAQVGAGATQQKTDKLVTTKGPAQGNHLH